MKKQRDIIEHGIHNPARLPRKRLLSVKDAAVYLGRSVPAIRELIWSGSLPYIRVDRRVHLDLFDLDKWIEQHKTRYTY